MSQEDREEPEGRLAGTGLAISRIRGREIRKECEEDQEGHEDQEEPEGRPGTPGKARCEARKSQEPEGILF